MHDDEFPTADSAQKWLSFHGWLSQKVREMQDKFLRDFSAPWAGAGDAKPPQDLYDESVALQRQQEKAAGTASYQGFVFSRDENGMLTIWQTGTRYITVSAAEYDGWLATLTGLAPAPDPVVIDLNTDGPNIPGSSSGEMSAPNTPMQWSMRQNELTLRALKKRR